MGPRRDVSVFSIYYFIMGTATAEGVDPSAGISAVRIGAISEKITSALRKRTRNDNNATY